MNNKFIRTLSPITLAVTITFDAAAICYSVFAVQKIKQDVDKWTVIFIIIMIFAVLLAIGMTANILKTGVILRPDEVEFNGLDDNNIFKYKEIESIDISRDVKLSLRKNFVDRYSVVILKLTDGSIVTLELGLTTGRKLKKIKAEIEKRL